MDGTSETDKQERRKMDQRISDDDLEAIAKRSAEIVQDNFTLRVGALAIRLFLYLCGAAFVALLAWAGIQGHLQRIFFN